MPTTAFEITPSWKHVADGPASVLIPAPSQFSFCVTDGPTPTLAPSVCPYRRSGSELSCELLDGESLYVTASVPFGTSVTTDA